jgi:plasmid stabilization system protein ParE
MSGFVLAPAAKREIAEIWTCYASEVGDVDLADRIRGEIFEGIRSVARTPGIGHLRYDLSDEPLRFWRVRNYLFIYRVGVRPMQVARVLHGARDVEAILARGSD